MFACSMYPGDADFLNSIRHEAEDNVKRLRNHACMALWCGNNEIETAWAQGFEDKGWGWKKDYNSSQREVIWKAYDTIFHHILPDVVDHYAHNQPYWHSSPSAECINWRLMKIIQAICIIGVSGMDYIL